MPVHTGKDSKGCFAQWGGHGKKYYYTCDNKEAQGRAKSKATAQGQAAYASGYRGNAMPYFQYVVSTIKPVVRQESMEGRDWVVAHTQMITEGVHNGSGGPIYYPAGELAKLPAAWNHKPVVVYHPFVNGTFVSACNPDQLTTRKVGIMLNTKWDDKNKKLATETWLDPSRIQAVDSRVANAIENNEMMEVSTGLFMDLENKEGVWNGEEYVAIARNLQPDHLALLPDQVGACSIEDGAGFLRLNQAGDDVDVKIIENDVDVTDEYIRIRQKNPKSLSDMKTIWLSKSKGIKAIIGKPEGSDSTIVQSFLFKKDKWDMDRAKEWVKKHKGTVSVNALVLNVISYDSVQMLLRGALRSIKEDAWIMDTYDEYFIYEEGGKLYKQKYIIDDGNVTFDGLPKLVEREVLYKEVTVMKKNNKVSEKGIQMDKKKVVDALIKNEKTSWTEEHREKLMALDEILLTNMQKDMEAVLKSVEKEEETKAKPGDTTANSQGIEVTNAQTQTQTKPMTTEEYIQNAPPDIREVLKASKASLDVQRSELIGNIMANGRNTFTKENLETKGLDELQALEKLANASPSNENRVPMFFGQEQQKVKVNVEPLPLPQMDFSKKTA